MQTTYSQPQTVSARPSSQPANRKAAPPQSEPATRQVTLSLAKPGARTVGVAGTFNNWESARTPMRKDESGAWKATLALAPGRYEYRFVVDGEWISDPSATARVANPFGQTNSVLTV